METNRTADQAETAPQRTCVGCRSTAPQHTLVRCVLDHEGVAVISRTAPGRGAWVCSTACIGLAVRKRAFERAWRRPVGAGALDQLAIAFESTQKNMRHWSVVGHGSDGPPPMKG